MSTIMSVNKVCYNIDQRADTGEEDKARARANIGAAAASEVPFTYTQRIADTLKAIDESIYPGFPSSSWGGVNTSHFNATPCGRLDPDEAPYKFIYFNEIGCWWSKSSYDYRDAYFLRLANNSDIARVGSYNKKLAYPIRLVKDS